MQSLLVIQSPEFRESKIEFAARGSAAFCIAVATAPTLQSMLTKDDEIGKRILMRILHPDPALPPNKIQKLFKEVILENISDSTMEVILMPLTWQLQIHKPKENNTGLVRMKSQSSESLGSVLSTFSVINMTPIKDQHFTFSDVAKENKSSVSLIKSNTSGMILKILKSISTSSIDKSSQLNNVTLPNKPPLILSYNVSNVTLKVNPSTSFHQMVTMLSTPIQFKSAQRLVHVSPSLVKSSSELLKPEEQRLDQESNLHQETPQCQMIVETSLRFHKKDSLQEMVSLNEGLERKTDLQQQFEIPKSKSNIKTEQKVPVQHASMSVCYNPSKKIEEKYLVKSDIVYQEKIETQVECKSYLSACVTKKAKSPHMFYESSTRLETKCNLKDASIGRDEIVIYQNQAIQTINSVPPYLPNQTKVICEDKSTSDHGPIKIGILPEKRANTSHGASSDSGKPLCTSNILKLDKQRCGPKLFVPRTLTKVYTVNSVAYGESKMTPDISLKNTCCGTKKERIPFESQFKSKLNHVSKKIRLRTAQSPSNGADQSQGAMKSRETLITRKESINHAQLTGVLPLIRRCYCTMNVQVAGQNVTRKHHYHSPRLEPIPYPHQNCVKRRLVRKTTTMSGTNRTFNTSSSSTPTVSSDSRTRKYYLLRHKVKRCTACTRPVVGFKYQISPRSRQRHKQDVPISYTSGSINDFSEPKLKLAHTIRMPKDQTASKSSKSYYRYIRNSSRGDYEVGRCQKQSQSLMSQLCYRASNVTPMLRRCFYSLKLQKKGRLQKKREMQPMNQSKPRFTKVTADKRALKTIQNMKKYRYAELIPYEYATNTCIPGECDPVWLEKKKRLELRKSRRKQTKDFVVDSNMSHFSTPSIMKTSWKRREKHIHFHDLGGHLRPVRSRNILVRPNPPKIIIKNSGTKRSRQPRVNSRFNFNEEKIYDLNKKEPTNFRKYAYTHGKIKDSFSQDEKPKRDTDVQTVFHKQSQSSGFLKRCFCAFKCLTTSLKHRGKPDNVGHERTSLTLETNIINTQKRDLIPNLVTYDCEPRVRGHCKTHQLVIAHDKSAGPSKRGRKPESLTKEIFFEETNVTPQFFPRRQTVKISSNTSLNGDFFKDKFPNYPLVQIAPLKYARPKRNKSHALHKSPKGPFSLDINAENTEKKPNQLQTFSPDKATHATKPYNLHSHQVGPNDCKPGVCVPGRGDDLNRHKNERMGEEPMYGSGAHRKSVLVRSSLSLNIDLVSLQSPSVCVNNKITKRVIKSTETSSTRTSSISSSGKKLCLRDCQSQSDCIKTNCKASRASLLQRCLCTLKLQKRGKHAPFTKSIGTDATKPMIVPGTREIGTKTNQKYQYVLEPYKCRPDICVPGYCNPYDCKKRKNLENMRHSGIGTTRTTKSMSSVTSRDVDIKGMNSYKQKRNKRRTASMETIYRNEQPHQLSYVNVKKESKGSTVKPKLKRCLCTLTLQRLEFKNRLRSLGIYKEEAKVLTTDKTTSTKKKYSSHPSQPQPLDRRSKETDNYTPKECKPGACVPGECDPSECLERNKRQGVRRKSRKSGTRRRRTSQVSVASTTAQFFPKYLCKKTQHENFCIPQKIDRIVEEPRFPFFRNNLRHNLKRGVNISSNFNINIEFYKEKLPFTINEEKYSPFQSGDATSVGQFEKKSGLKLRIKEVCPNCLVLLEQTVAVRKKVRFAAVCSNITDSAIIRKQKDNLCVNNMGPKIVPCAIHWILSPWAAAMPLGDNLSKLKNQQYWRNAVTHIWSATSSIFYDAPHMADHSILRGVGPLEQRYSIYVGT
ncbi:hypothetical protein HW555_011164 [Spodoptera exigua]|uniref:Uncharacterized protein n=1 Tax=Spodoptera exigua TaxID=7107 RepID=A0A835G9D7_SPOEX|nr:hypothetical protein HW555_011164 [Spodoptera exigua]